MNEPTKRLRHDDIWGDYKDQRPAKISGEAQSELARREKTRIKKFGGHQVASHDKPRFSMQQLIKRRLFLKECCVRPRNDLLAVG
jgi:hypothetical protein